VAVKGPVRDLAHHEDAKQRVLLGKIRQKIVQPSHGGVEELLADVIRIPDCGYALEKCVDIDCNKATESVPLELLAGFCCSRAELVSTSHSLGCHPPFFS